VIDDDPFVGGFVEVLMDVTCEGVDQGGVDK
jgi:hypothetical protein